jgi:hypothetical protein
VCGTAWDTEVMDTFSTDAWQIALPADWSPKPASAAGEVEFESGDGAKGIFIGTWRIDEDAARTPRAVAESFRASNIASLAAMASYEWKMLVDEIVDLGPLSVVLSDAWDRAQSYRIIGVVIARPPLVVRASFHDYLCENVDASRAYFAAIVESLQLVDQPE